MKTNHYQSHQPPHRYADVYDLYKINALNELYEACKFASASFVLWIFLTRTREDGRMKRFHSDWENSVHKILKNLSCATLILSSSVRLAIIRSLCPAAVAATIRSRVSNTSAARRVFRYSPYPNSSSLIPSSKPWALDNIGQPNHSIPSVWYICMTAWRAFLTNYFPSTTGYYAINTCSSRENEQMKQHKTLKRTSPLNWVPI